MQEKYARRSSRNHDKIEAGKGGECSTISESIGRVCCNGWHTSGRLQHTCSVLSVITLSQNALWFWQTLFLKRKTWVSFKVIRNTYCQGFFSRLLGNNLQRLLLPRILPSTEALEKTVYCNFLSVSTFTSLRKLEHFGFSKSGCWDFYCSWVQQSVAKNTEWGL